MAVATKFREYLSPGGSSEGERKLVQKLDFFILTFCCLMYFLNYVSLPCSLIHSSSANECI
jgi:ACS family pantothenate transporter-like MFS transporter